jgi:hypothetical protein
VSVNRPGSVAGSFSSFCVFPAKQGKKESRRADSNR